MLTSLAPRNGSTRRAFANAQAQRKISFVQGVARKVGGNVSWFFHGGEYSDAPDFYQPVHVGHLKEILPSVIRYMRLPTGEKFIIDDQGYEDVWFAQ
jgi:hypothetical protein